MRRHHKRAGDTYPHLADTRTSLVGVTEDQVHDVYRLMYRYVGNREEAEELTEPACTRAVRAARQDFPDAPDRQSVAILLCRVARSVLEEHLRWFYRSSSRSPQNEDVVMLQETTAVGHSEGASASDRAGRILAQLSARERDVLTLRFFRQASLAETAAQMHLSPDDTLALQWFALHHAAQLAAKERTIPSAPATPDAASCRSEAPGPVARCGCRG